MPDYKEATGEGKMWKRCFSVTINNPLDGDKGVTFFEEEVIDFQSKKLNRESSRLSLKFAENGEFQIYDPITSLPIEGQIGTHQQLYALMFSLYLDSALKRDQANQVVMGNAV